MHLLGQKSASCLLGTPTPLVGSNQSDNLTVKRGLKKGGHPGSASPVTVVERVPKSHFAMLLCDAHYSMFDAKLPRNKKNNNNLKLI